MIIDVGFLSTLLSLRHQAVQAGAPVEVKEAIDLQLKQVVGAAPVAKVLTLVAANDDEVHN